MRIFTAVELPETVRSALDDRLARLLGSTRGVQTVAPENLHVTLRFLGQVDPALVADLLGAVQRAAGRVRTANVAVRGFGAFPRPERPRVIWSGVKDPRGALKALFDEISTELVPLGFEPEERAYHAHVTLLRIRRGRAAPPQLIERLAEGMEEDPSFGSFTVDRVTVVESRLGRGSGGGPDYTALARFPLRETPNTRSGDPR